MPSNDDDLDQKSKLLGDKITQAQHHHSNAYSLDKSKKNNAVSIAMRSGVELVSGILVGVGLGMLCDYLFDTKPIGMILFLFLGMAAGVSNIYRSMKNIL